MLRNALKLTFILVLTLGPACFSGCDSKSSSDSAKHSSALLVHPKAESVEFVKYEGTDQVSYRLKIKYPASGLVGWVSFRLDEMGWSPLVRDYLNPNLSSSHVRGWTSFVTAGEGDKRVYQWLGDWQNGTGDIVRYEFRYAQTNNESPNLTDAEVSGIFIPSSLAKQTLESIKKHYPQK